MNVFQKMIKEADTIAIGGHIRPDGDCVGSCMALYKYIRKVYPQKDISVYLEEIPQAFYYLKEEKAFLCGIEKYDLFVSLDCGDTDRLGDAWSVFQKAKKTINIDHHISNTEFGMENIVVADASSTCEVLYTLIEEAEIDKDIAAALYTGIIHDTGVFKHSNTSKKTMEIAGTLMQTGIEFGRIIDESFYLKNYTQLQIMGRCLLSSIRVMEGACIISVVSQRMLEFYEAKSSDLDGIIDQMRTTEGVEVAILLTEKGSNTYKVSMRSNNLVNVSEICQFYGGGGHIRAAGCQMEGSQYDVMNNLTNHIARQMNAGENE